MAASFDFHSVLLTEVMSIKLEIEHPHHEVFHQAQNSLPDSKKLNHSQLLNILQPIAELTI